MTGSPKPRADRIVPLRGALRSLLLLGVLWTGTSAAEGEAPVGLAGPDLPSVRVSESLRRDLGIRLEPARIRAMERAVTLVGWIEPDPSRSRTVSSSVSGRVAAHLVREGQRVGRGEPLLEIEILEANEPGARKRSVAPVAGVVTYRRVVQGQRVHEGDPLVELAEVDRVMAVAPIPPGSPEIRIGQPARIQPTGANGDAIDGVVVAVDPTGDPTAGSIVRARVPNPGAHLDLHTRVTFTVVAARVEAAVTVPRQALRGDFGEPVLFVEDPDEPERIQRRRVGVGLTDEDRVQIVSGVGPGERVVSDGAYSLPYLLSWEDPVRDPPAPEVATAPPRTPGRGVAAALLVALGLGLVVLGARRRRARRVSRGAR